MVIIAMIQRCRRAVRMSSGVRALSPAEGLGDHKVLTLAQAFVRRQQRVVTARK